MIEVATIKEARAITESDDGRRTIAIEAGSLCRVYFEGDELPAHMIVTEPTEQELTAQIREHAKALLDANEADDQRFKAFVLVVLDEINALRAKAGMTARTVTQLKNAMRNKIDGGETG